MLQLGAVWCAMRQSGQTHWRCCSARASSLVILEGQYVMSAPKPVLLDA